jgi:hypothetical protein
LNSGDNQYSSATVKLKPKTLLSSYRQRSGSNPAHRSHTSLGRRDLEEAGQKKPSFIGKLKGMFSK